MSSCDLFCEIFLLFQMHSLDMAFSVSRKIASTRQQAPTMDFSPHHPTQFPLGIKQFINATFCVLIFIDSHFQVLSIESEFQLTIGSNWNVSKLLLKHKLRKTVLQSILIQIDPQNIATNESTVRNS